MSQLSRCSTILTSDHRDQPLDTAPSDGSIARQWPTHLRLRFITSELVALGLLGLCALGDLCLGGGGGSCTPELGDRQEGEGLVVGGLGLAWRPGWGALVAGERVRGWGAPRPGSSSEDGREGREGAGVRRDTTTLLFFLFFSSSITVLQQGSG